MKILLFNAYGTKNRGDAELLSVAVRQIRDVYGLAASIGIVSFEMFSPDVLGAGDDIHCFRRLGASPAFVENRWVGRMLQLLQLLALFLPASVGHPLLRVFCDKSQLDGLDFAKESSVFVSAPGGYIQDSNFAYLVALAAIKFYADIGPVVLANQSVGPVRGRFAKILGRAVLSKSKAVVARESYSYNFCIRDLSLRRDLVLRGGDLAFWSESPKRTADGAAGLISSLRPNEPFIGVTIVEWSFPGSLDAEASRLRYLSSMAALLRELVRLTGFRIVIFNQVSGDSPAVLKVIDLADLGESLLYDSVEREPEELRALISSSVFFVGSRFHSCIFAMTAGVPTFAIAYLPKTSFILQDLGLSRFSVDINEIDQQELVQRVVEAFRDREAGRTKLQAGLVAYRKKFSSLGDVLRRLELG